MDGDRTHRAVARIEAALARVEAAVRHSAQSTDSTDDLARRHAGLREEVARTVAELDSLIGGNRE
jgi:uncharacterized small protein (DUF1192 family)